MLLLLVAGRVPEDAVCGSLFLRPQSISLCRSPASHRSTNINTAKAHSSKESAMPAVDFARIAMTIPRMITSRQTACSAFRRAATLCLRFFALVNLLYFVAIPIPNYLFLCIFRHHARPRGSLSPLSQPSSPIFHAQIAHTFKLSDIIRDKNHM